MVDERPPAEDSDGGREDGDVELALFRRCSTGPSYASESLDNNGHSVLASSSDSNADCPTPQQSISPDNAADAKPILQPNNNRSPFARYQYPRDPLSMFSAARDRLLSRTYSRRNVLTAYADPAATQHKKTAHLPNNSHTELVAATGNSAPVAANTQVLTTQPLIPPHQTASMVPAEEPSAESYRQAMVRACANLSGKSIEKLMEEYDASGGPGKGELAPRDFTDFAIMTTLKSRDAFEIHNAPSWLFTVMDRTGAGFVLREEFVKYTPFMAPVADAAVASTIFDELIRAQVAAAEALEKDPRKKSGGKDPRGPSLRDNAESLISSTQQNPTVSDSVQELYPISAALRFPTWKQYFDNIKDKVHRKDEDWERVKRDFGLDPTERLVRVQGAIDHSDLWPTLGKLFLSQRYLVFLAAVGRNHYVARLGAVAEVGTRSLPLLMRDCFTVKLDSERASAMNGVSAPVDAASIMARSLGKRPRARANNEGIRGKALGTPPRMQSSPGSSGSTSFSMVSLTRPSPRAPVGGEDSPEGSMDEDVEYADLDDQEQKRSLAVIERTESDGRSQDSVAFAGWPGNEVPLPQHIRKVMQKFTEGGKLLVFSFIELRDTHHRDIWVRLVKEMSDAHKLHLKLGFGASGRIIPKLYSGVDPISAGGIQVPPSRAELGDEAPEGGDNGDAVVTEGASGSYLTYLLSPFRNEPPPPLLAVAAHANILRFFAIRELKGVRDPVALLVFSNPERFSRAVTWYVDSVRAHDDRSGRSWIERALGAIIENMELNKRMYHAQGDEPFDVAQLGEGIGRLAELCTPVVRLFQFINHLLQWRNPPATVLALLMSMLLVYMDWVKYLPSAALLLQAGLIVATRSDTLGLAGWMWGGGRPEDARQRQANVLELVAQVHDTLRAAQNIIKRLNRGLGKVQTLCLWGSGEEWQSWVLVGMITGIGLLVFLLEARYLFGVVVIFLCHRHFAPPKNLGRKFWGGVPDRVVTYSRSTSTAGTRRKKD